MTPSPPERRRPQIAAPGVVARVPELMTQASAHSTVQQILPVTLEDNTTRSPSASPAAEQSRTERDYQMSVVSPVSPASSSPQNIIIRSNPALLHRPFNPRHANVDTMAVDFSERTTATAVPNGASRPVPIPDVEIGGVADEGAEGHSGEDGHSDASLRDDVVLMGLQGAADQDADREARGDAQGGPKGSGDVESDGSARDGQQDHLAGEGDEDADGETDQEGEEFVARAMIPHAMHTAYPVILGDSQRPSHQEEQSAHAVESHRADAVPSVLMELLETNRERRQYSSPGKPCTHRSLSFPTEAHTFTM